MPKPMYVWSGTAWVSVASEVESLATYATQSYADNQPGMKLVVPTSVAVGSGSGSVATQGTVSFSGASSVSVNGCFSSTYNDYLVYLEATPSTATTNSIRMRVSGTDETGSNYTRNLNLFATTLTNSVTGTGTSHQITDSAASSYFRYTFFVNKPFATDSTMWRGVGHIRNATSLDFYGTHTQSISYDGFTLFVASGTLTGTIRVYGLKIG